MADLVTEGVDKPSPAAQIVSYDWRDGVAYVIVRRDPADEASHYLTVIAGPDLRLALGPLDGHAVTVGPKGEISIPLTAEEAEKLRRLRIAR